MGSATDGGTMRVMFHTLNAFSRGDAAAAAAVLRPDGLWSNLTDEVARTVRRRDAQQLDAIVAITFSA